MLSMRKRRKRLLRWERYMAHYPDAKATPACVRAQDEAHYAWADDEFYNPYAGAYGALVRADMERLGMY